MTSLAEAYDQRAGEVGRERLFLGTGLFLVGASMVVLAIVAAATTLPTDLGIAETVYDARTIAGVIGGLGVPAVFVGIFAVLPASRFQRAAAAIGAGIAVLGVVLFYDAYPFEWYAAEGVPTTLVLVMAVVYFFGVLTTFWCLFTAVATFKRRNDPGGTVTLTYTRGGETKTVRVAAEDAADARAALGGGAGSGGSGGGIGVLGSFEDPDEDEGGRRPGRAGNATVPTDDGARVTDGSTVSDGGASATTSHDGSEVLTDGPADGPVDRYCGNCAHFDYVRTDDGIQQYCGHDDRLMDDMDPCDHWESNSS